jgi:sugar phosphate isomerase/epimerase
MSAANTFRQGTSLYSFQSEYLRFQLSFEDCMQLASQLGDRGVEIVGPMHVRTWPEVSNEFERQFKSGCHRFNLTPTAFAAYGDDPVFDNSDEVFDFYLLQMKGASRLGFPLMRGPSGDYAMIDRLLPYAEKLNVKMIFEIHAPMALGKDPATIELVEWVRKKSSGFLGFNPDGGSFTNKISSFVKKMAAGYGVPDAIINRCIELYDSKVPRDKAIEEAKKMSSDQIAVWAVNTFYGQAPASDPEELKKIIPYVLHFHGKFWTWEIGQEPAIPYEQIIRALVEGGWSAGWLSTEFEAGGPETDSFEVVKGFQEMVRGFVAKYSRS